MPLKWTKSRPLSFARSVNQSDPSLPRDEDASAAAGGGTGRSPQPASSKLIRTAASIAGMQATVTNSPIHQFTNLPTYQLTNFPHSLSHHMRNVPVVLL